MKSTYCESTGKNKFAIHLNKAELGVISDLLNSFNSGLIKNLKNEVNNLIRSDSIYTLIISRNTLICQVCGGTGQLIEDQVTRQVHFSNDLKTKICQNCNGQGRIVLSMTQRTEPFDPAIHADLINYPQRKLKNISKSITNE
jgi:hypothetical protein